MIRNNLAAVGDSLETGSRRLLEGLLSHVPSEGGAVTPTPPMASSVRPLRHEMMGQSVLVRVPALSLWE